MKAEKVKMGEGYVSGGLFDLTQVYSINYIKKEGKLVDKIELAIKLMRNNENNGKEYAYLSLIHISEPTRPY